MSKKLIARPCDLSFVNLRRAALEALCHAFANITIRQAGASRFALL
jgi:hypothetical protein